MTYTSQRGHCTLAIVIHLWDLARKVQIGSSLPCSFKNKHVSFLWKKPGCHHMKSLRHGRYRPSIICHQLNVNSSSVQVKQKKRNIEPKRRAVEEVNNSATKFIWKVYLNLLANMVLVRKSSKSSRKWRMCIDYMSIWIKLVQKNASFSPELIHSSAQPSSTNY